MSSFAIDLHEAYNVLLQLKFPIIILLSFSTLASTINTLFYQFQGNNFLKYSSISTLFLLFINSALFFRIFGVQVISKKIIQECLLFFLIYLLIIFATNSIQYTPFNPIDSSILALEKKLHINLLSIVIWTKQHPDLHLYLKLFYSVLEYEVVFLPLYVLIVKRYQYLHEYYYLVVTTSCIGFIFYYFFPTTGPASNLSASYFSTDQLATGLKFWQIHHHQQPTTQVGGLIALPSFHVIWAWLNVYLIRFKPLYCTLFAIINFFMTCSCVFLGWHYFLDIIGSFAVLGISFYCYKNNFRNEY